MTLIIRQAFQLLVTMTVLTGLLYPLLMTGVAQALFSAKANGSLIQNSEGKTIGSALLGQTFEGPAYFWSRPSATSPFSYNAESSSGSNLGPLHPDLKKWLKE